MKKQTKEKLIAVLVVLGLLVYAVVALWDILTAGVITLGRLMSGDHPPLDAKSWLVLAVCLLIFAAVVAGLVFLVKLIIRIIKAKGSE